METFCRNLLFIALVFSGAEIARAQTPDAAPEKNMYTWRDGRELNLDETADEKSLLGEIDYARYQNDLRAFNCEPANKLLKEAFAARYPAYAEILKYESNDYRDWEYGFIPRKYPGIRFCRIVKVLNRLKSVFGDEYAMLGNFRRPNFRPPHNTLWYLRDTDIEDLYDLIVLGHPPALVYMADLAGLGTIFADSAEVEYFMLQRACAKNHRCGEFTGRIELLEDELPDDRQDDLKRDARHFPMRAFFWDHFPGYVREMK